MEHFDVLIVGGGHAAAALSANLRRLGSTKTIGIIGDDPHLPYERPPLSKAYLSGLVEPTDLLLREEQYWIRNNVVLHVDDRVVRVDPERKSIECASGLQVAYSDLVWATGGRARPLPVPGAGAVGVHYVRTLLGVTALRDAARSAQHAVIIGAGYIGMETAAIFKSVLGIPSVTVVESFDRVLARVTSPPVSSYIQYLHATHGVQVRLGASVSEIQTVDNKVSGVVVDGETLPADIVVVGIGIIPNTEPLVDAGVECSNGVDTDPQGNTSAPHVWALGDCANTVDADGERRRLESSPNVSSRAMIVAAAILDEPLPAVEPAWFWSDQFTARIKTVGVLTGYDALEVVGDPHAGEFAVRYFKEGDLIAVDTINSPGEFAKAKKLMKLPRDRRLRDVVPTSVLKPEAVA